MLMSKTIAILILLFLSPLNMSLGQEKQVELKDAKAKGRNYELVMADLNDRWTAIRFDTQTGASSIIVNEIWVQIKESKEFKPMPKARFVVKLTAFAKDKFAAIRMDKKTGASWFLKDRRWVPITVFDE